MRTLAKIVGIFILIFGGLEFSVAQVNNNANNQNTTNTQPNANGQNNTNNQSNANNQNQVQVQTQPQPQAPVQSQPSVLSPQPLDGAYKSENNPYRRVVLPAFIRESDVMWQTRVWRTIDTRQKMNLSLYYPVQPNGNRISLYELLKDALLEGEITAYNFNPVDWDAFTPALTKTELTTQLNPVDTIQDENGNTKVVSNPVSSDKIRGYMIKEDWIFDKQRSVLDPRILFICPLIATINQNTGAQDANAAPTELFWIYFPAIRPLLAKTPVFNPKNDAAWLTFDDIFWKRQFASYIIQQNNVYNRSIAAYLKGVDALLEGQKVHNEIEDVESNMWNY